MSLPPPSRSAAVTSPDMSRAFLVACVSWPDSLSSFPILSHFFLAIQKGSTNNTNTNTHTRRIDKLVLCPAKRITRRRYCYCYCPNCRHSSAPDAIYRVTAQLGTRSATPQLAVDSEENPEIFLKLIILLPPPPPPQKKNPT